MLKNKFSPLHTILNKMYVIKKHKHTCNLQIFYVSYKQEFKLKIT